MDIPTLYAGIAGPALAESEVCGIDDHACIWREHVKSAIIRSVIECCFVEVMARAEQFKQQQEKNAATSSGEGMTHARTRKNASVLILCPEKEYHELGARMVTDFFLLNGWDAHFAGANTPREQVRAAVLAVHPAIVALSVSDYYNLVEARKAIDGLHVLLEEEGWTDTRIFVGGAAFAHNPDMARQMGADGLLMTWEDICQLSPTAPTAGNDKHIMKGGNTP